MSKLIIKTVCPRCSRPDYSSPDAYAEYYMIKRITIEVADHLRYSSDIINRMKLDDYDKVYRWCETDFQRKNISQELMEVSDE